MSNVTAAADVHIIPMRQDNYAYIIVDRATKIAACVDPYTPDKILKKIEELNADLRYCLTTHYHHDHAGGNEELHKKCGGKIQFIASGYEDTPCTTDPKKHGDTFHIGDLQCTVFRAGCHTRGHVLYYIEDPKTPDTAPILLTGDTLFVAGCGRFFEGGAEDMLNNMNLIASLNPNTLLYVGHEYTVNNLKFAQSLEPQNTYVNAKLRWAVDKRNQGLPTVPAILKEELLYNPFFRCEQLKSVLNVSDVVACMAECRSRKDRF